MFACESILFASLNVNHRDAKSGRSGRYICTIFPAGANFWAMHAKKNVPAPVLLALVSTGAVSTNSIIFSAMGTFY